MNEPAKASVTEADGPGFSSRLTAPIPAGIASLAVQGKAAVERVIPLLNLKSSRLEIGRIYFGAIALGTAGSNEDIVVCKTTTDTLQIHCHGGKAVSQLVLDLLHSTGAETISAEHFVANATSRIQHLAEQALLKARTNRSAGYLLDQVNGVLETGLGEVLRELETKNLPSALSALNTISQHDAFAQRLTEGWDVVIAGPPNVGKSSLLNRLMGQQKSIVTAEAGTTRDWVEANTAIEGWPVRLSDTAGLRDQAESQIESTGINFAQQRIRGADVVVIVVDSQTGWQATHDSILQACNGDLVGLTNKCDLDGANLGALPKGINFIPCSCVTGENIDGVMQALAQIIAAAAPPEGIPLATHATIRDLLSEIRQFIEAEKLEEAAKMLRAVLEKPGIGIDG